MDVFWIFIAFLQPVFHGVANVLDNVLANRRLPDLWTLVFYASLFNLIFIPFIFWLDPPQSITGLPLFLLCILGFTNFAYLFPYYRSLQIADTSVVISLFSMTRILIPVFAYLFVGEKLHGIQYAGFILIVLASTITTFDPSRFRFNRALWWMVLASLIIAVHLLIYKWLFENGVNWGTAFAGQGIVSFLLAMPLLLFMTRRKAIIDGWTVFRGSLPIFVIEEAVTTIGSGAGAFAISMVPLTLEQSVESFQPFMVLVYALLFAKRFPKAFTEKTERKALLKKSLAFALMVVGIIMVVQTQFYVDSV